MNTHDYVKVFSGPVGLPLMIGHAADLGIDLPCVFAGLAHSSYLPETLDAMAQLRTSSLPSPIFNLLRMPRGVLIIPEDYQISPEMKQRFGNGYDKAPDGIVLQRVTACVSGRFEEQMRYSVLDFIRTGRRLALHAG